MGDWQGDLQREEVELRVLELSIASDSTVKGCQPRRTGFSKDPALQLGTQCGAQLRRTLLRLYQSVGHFHFRSTYSIVDIVHSSNHL